MLDPTTLLYIENEFGGDIVYYNTEANRTKTIHQQDKMKISEYIPWCDDSEQFASHHIIIKSAKFIYSIWQSGQNIFYNPENRYTSNPRVLYPGVKVYLTVIVNSKGEISAKHV